jgi:hypothetical protein
MRLRRSERSARGKISCTLAVALSNQLRADLERFSPGPVGLFTKAGGGRMPSARSRASGRGRAVRVARDVQRAGELAFGDGERTEAHVKFVGDLPHGERSPRPEQATGASQGDDGTGGPRLRPAVADDAEARSVGDHLPGGPGVGPPEAARIPRGGQGGGTLAGPSVVAHRRWLCTHRLEYRRRPEAIGAQLLRNRSPACENKPIGRVIRPNRAQPLAPRRTADGPAGRNPAVLGVGHSAGLG